MTYDEWCAKNYPNGHPRAPDWMRRAYEDGQRDGAATEREACAAMCEDAIGTIADTPLSTCAKLIRARSTA